ncbi:MAG: glycosyl hydrolase family 65 protein [Actinomycetota bacterium]
MTRWGTAQALGGADTWLLSEDRFVPSLAPAHESVFTIANGYLSTRGTFEERTAGETRASFIHGLWVTPPGESVMLGAVPDWTELSLAFEGVPFTVEPTIAGYRRTLDLRQGLLEREVLWRSAETGVVLVRFRRLLSMAERHLAGLEVTLVALTEPTDVWFETGLDTAIPSPAVPAWHPRKWEQPTKNQLDLEAESTNSLHTLRVQTEVGGPGRFQLIRDPRNHRFATEVRLRPGIPVTFTKYTIYHSDRDPGPPPSLPSSVPFERVVARSARAWARRWRAAGIEIDGDPEAEFALRFAAFQLIGAAPPNDTGAAIGAKLGSGFGYRHHVFWDADLFVVPYLTVTAPDLARNHLGYRYRGLDGARRKAKKFGREGAFYAWESASTGDEVTPEWGDPRFGPPSRIWTGEIEEHITSDVAYTAHHYWSWTRDDRFMRTEGAEMIMEGARYWASRLEVEGASAHIRDIIGPDEYHSHVDDSFYTNLMASWHLRTAAQLLELGYGRGLASEVSSEGWRKLAKKVSLRHRPDGVWEQHTGFFELAPVNIASFTPRRMSMYDLLGEERAERSQVIKQADVVMAMALLPSQVGSAARRKANWDYYLPRCDHGSSLSMAAHARVAAELGLVETGYEMFRRAVAIDLGDAMGNSSDGLHAATQGGILQAALFGFAGLHLREQGPQVRPRLPAHWKRFAFSFQYRGDRHDTELVSKPSAERRTPRLADQTRKETWK